MVPKEVIQQITSDERLKVPFYAKLEDFLAMPEEEQQIMIELVNVFVKPRAEAKRVLIMPRRENVCYETNDTDDVSAPLFNPSCAFIQKRLNFNPSEHDQKEIRTAIDAYRELYQMTYEEKVAMDLSDTEYADFAYQMDTCFLCWHYQQVL